MAGFDLLSVVALLEDIPAKGLLRGQVGTIVETLAPGRGIRVLAVVDAFTRENLSLEVDTSLSSRRVTRALEGVIERRGKPEAIRCDNGPELTSRHFLSWCEERKIQLIHIQPGRPMQNGHVESFNGRLRKAAHAFKSGDRAQYACLIEVFPRSAASSKSVSRKRSKSA